MTKQRYPLLVRKATGELEVFLPEKLRKSLRNSGANSACIERVMALVNESIHEGMSTREIYKMAYRILKRESKPVAVRYKLRQAVLEMGPSGYAFERLIGEVFKAQGYTTRVGVTVQGHCVAHEVDVVAQKEDHHVMAECKFHNKVGEKSDVKTAMYIHARFQDIGNKYKASTELRSLALQPWLITNTKFSSDAIAFGTCSKLNMMSWSYPEQGNLQHVIEKYCLYPLTSLAGLTLAQKHHLLREGVVLFRDILSSPDALALSGVGEKRAQAVLHEVEMMMCQPA